MGTPEEAARAEIITWVWDTFGHVPKGLADLLDRYALAVRWDQHDKDEANMQDANGYRIGG